MENVELIPLELLFGDAEVLYVKISPEGRYVSYVSDYEGYKNIWILDRKTGEKWPLTRDKEYEAIWYKWLWTDDYLLYFQDRHGDENYRIYRMDIKKNASPVLLTPDEDIQTTILRYNPKRRDNVLITMNRRDRRYFDVYELNVKTGEIAKVMENSMGAVEFVADENYRVRSYTISKKDGGMGIYILNNGKWELFLDVPQEDEMTTGIVEIRNDNIYMVSSIGRDKAALLKVGASDFAEKIIYEDDEYDVSGNIIFPFYEKEPEAVMVVKDRPQWQVLNPLYTKEYALLSDNDSGVFISANSRTLNGDIWCVTYEGDRQSEHYYLYHRKDKKLEFLFKSRPKLEEYPLSAMKPITYRSRDGLVIHGYLTLPVGKSPHNLPVVVMPHGGPWYRSMWGYRSDVQWLANRGYAVFQPNFRGSTGYGKAFVNAGDREWGGKMQDDITDGVKWLIEKGIANPKRIAIFGGSYGGYATLAGLAFTPELYRVGIDLFGVSNIITFMESIPPYWTPLLSMLYKRIGHPQKDKEFLKQRSPLFKADSIRVPLLVGQGKNDVRVKREESLRIVSTLKDRGIPVEYIEYPDEGHGFVKARNKLDFYRHAEEFLNKYMKDS